MSFVRYSLFISVFVRAASLQCKNSDGKPVDWYAMYKMPKIRGSGNPLVKLGLAAMYLDGTSPSWKQSPHPINSTQQALYQTLAPIYSEALGDELLIMYNDDFPNRTRTTYNGHTKGVVAFDKEAGFWLVHSVPSFPSGPTEGYKWPQQEFALFGQSFLCISFPYTALEDIGQQLFFNYPYVYEQQVPSAFQGKFPILSEVGHKHPKSAPWTSTRLLSSLGGLQFTSFAKFTKFNADLYEDLVAPALKSSLLVETWRHGKGDLPTNCSGPYKVMTVENVTVNGGPGPVAFGVENDHAKWAVSLSQDRGWTCIGDINRQDTQFKRAGGTVCFQNPGVWQTYRKSVAKFDDC